MKVLILGAGEIASGTALRLHACGFELLMTEKEKPLAVRRTVSFCEAVQGGETAVEGVVARRVRDLVEAEEERRAGSIPVLVDPDGREALSWGVDALVDGRMMKRNHGLGLSSAPRVIGLGPGFTAGVDCHFVVETARGHDLGRVLADGSGRPDTGVPGPLGGESMRRVVRAPGKGVFTSDRRIGEPVRAGEEVGRVGGEPVRAAISGTLRGQIRPGTPVDGGMKIGDIDPRPGVNPLLTSDKARAVAGGVLEALLRGNPREEPPQVKPR
ncbi:MAG: selenium-dependent molybdenum cofactor biosynthesis protein YqeB [Candidatus Eisenbacteria bacterium]